MIRALAAASTVFLALGLCPQATAAEGDQTLRVNNGQIRCLVSTDYENRGRPATACARVDGRPFGTSPSQQNVAVVQGTGELYFVKGTIPGPDSADIVLGTDQTYHVNGWTVYTEPLRTVIIHDDGEHGFRMAPADLTPIWGYVPFG